MNRRSVLLCIVAAQLASAQGRLGSIDVTVIDDKGNPVADASIEAHMSTTGATAIEQTDSSGFRRLNPRGSTPVQLLLMHA